MNKVSLIPEEDTNMSLIAMLSKAGRCKGLPMVLAPKRPFGIFREE
jgi:hypothetical protein